MSVEPENLTEVIRLNITRIREQKGMTSNELEDLIDDADLELDTLPVIAKALGVDVSTLVKWLPTQSDRYIEIADQLLVQARDEIDKALAIGADRSASYKAGQIRKAKFLVEHAESNCWTAYELRLER